MNCRACASASLVPVFEMAPMPLAGAFADTQHDALKAKQYPLTWLWCQSCGLVNVAPDIPDAEIYAHYSYRTGDVPGLVKHHTEFADFLRPLIRPRDRVLEIGGNDGTLLAQLPGKRVNVDPSDIAAKHKRPGYELINAPFGSDLGLRGFDLIVSSNAFAHFTAIGDALAAVRDALTPDGSFIVEVHDLHATLESAQWDTVYHEHKVEWSADSLRNAGAKHGLDLSWFTKRPLHGGLIRAVFRNHRALPGKPVKPVFDHLRRAYATRTKPTLPSGSVAYGAAARATVYLNQVKPDVMYVVDGSPRRAGRFVPGTGHEIITPAQFDQLQTAAALITAWNHADDIKAKHPDYKGQWVTAW